MYYLAWLPFLRTTSKPCKIGKQIPHSQCRNTLHYDIRPCQLIPYLSDALHPFDINMQFNKCQFQCAWYNQGFKKRDVTAKTAVTNRYRQRPLPFLPLLTLRKKFTAKSPLHRYGTPLRPRNAVTDSFRLENSIKTFFSLFSLYKHSLWNISLDSWSAWKSKQNGILVCEIWCPFEILIFFMRMFMFVVVSREARGRRRSWPPSFLVDPWDPLFFCPICRFQIHPLSLLLHPCFFNSLI